MPDITDRTVENLAGFNGSKSKRQLLFIDWAYKMGTPPHRGSLLFILHVRFTVDYS